jgi:hypothetical protein
MKVKSLICLICLCACGSAALAVPEPNFVDPGPGLDLPFNNGDAVANGYGKQDSSYGWLFDTWAGTSLANTQALARYRPTLKNDSANWTPMAENVDWVFRLTYNHTGPYSSSEAAILLKYEWDGSRENRMFMLINNGVDENGWTIRAGDNAGGWVDVVTGVTIPAWADITVHYKAGTQTMDAYINGVKVAADFTTGHGRYDVTFLEFRNINNGNGEGRDAFRQIKLAQLGQIVAVCGDAAHPILVGDMDQNCLIDLLDLAIFLEEWTACTAPECD